MERCKSVSFSVDLEYTDCVSLDWNKMAKTGGGAESGTIFCSGLILWFSINGVESIER